MIDFLDDLECSIEEFWSFCNKLIHRYDDILLLLFIFVVVVGVCVGWIWSYKS